MSLADLSSALSSLGPYAGILVMVAVEAFFSGSETGAYRVNRVRLRLDLDQGRRGARALADLLHDMPGLICTTLIGTNLAVYGATTLATRLWEGAVGTSVYGEMMATLCLAPVLFVFAEVLPKNVYNAEADRMMYAGARPLWAANRAFRAVGLVLLLRGIGSLWNRLARRREGQAQAGADPFPPQARLRSIMRDSAAEGIVTPYQNELVEKILSLRDVHVGDAMVPARRVVSIRRDASADEFRQMVRSHPFSRVPVTDASGDVVGVLPIHDVLGEPMSDETFDLGLFAKPAVILSPTMTVTQAIFALQRNRAPLAAVRSDRGQFVGIVTLKDLVEEIVGELEAW